MRSRLDIAVDTLMEKLADVVNTSVTNSYNFYEDTGVDEEHEDWAGLRQCIMDVINEASSN